MPRCGVSVATFVLMTLFYLTGSRRSWCCDFAFVLFCGVVVDGCIFSGFFLTVNYIYLFLQYLLFIVGFLLSPFLSASPLRYFLFVVTLRFSLS